MHAEHTSPGGTGPALVVRSQSANWSLPAGPAYLIGRDPACDVVVADDRVSWQHAVLRFEEGGWVLADNGSTNGTYAGDRRGGAGGEHRGRGGRRGGGPPGAGRRWTPGRRRGRARPPARPRLRARPRGGHHPPTQEPPRVP